MKSRSAMKSSLRSDEIPFWPGIRLWRRYPHSSPDKRACRSSSVVCEPDSASPTARRTASNLGALPHQKQKGHPRGVSFCFWRCRPDLNRRITVLQTGALPLGYCTKFLIALTLYQTFLRLSSAFLLYFMLFMSFVQQKF